MSYFFLFEAALKNSRVYKNKTTHLSLSDKPELFYVFNRLTEGMTELINGGSIAT